MLFVCFALSSSPAPVIVIVPLTNMYASLELHKSDFNIIVLNLTWLPVLYTPYDSSFNLTKIFFPKFGWLIWFIV